MRPTLALSIAALLLAFAAPARADEDACAADRARLCTATKGRGRAACMNAHEADLSAACKAQRAAAPQAPGAGAARDKVKKRPAAAQPASPAK